jgi:tripartite-type tricarboxylate transporter receptor subunit TctC
MDTTLATRRRLLAAATATALALPGRGFAQAPAYPAKPVRMIVPYPAGGATDVAARAVAGKLQEMWGQGVVVENKPGASGVIGNDMVAKAAPDGYTILATITALIQQPPMMKNLPYDPLRDLAPVSQVVLSGNLFCVAAAVPANTLAEFIALAKGNPKIYNYGSFGTGSSSHIQGAILNLQAGLDMEHVPYKGSAPLLNDLMGGQLTAAFVDATTASPHLKSGKFKVLAAGGTQRNRATPGVATFQELGYPSFDWYGWVGMFMPAGTPAAIIAKVSADTARVVRMPDVAARFETLGLQPVGSTPEEWARVLRNDARLFDKIIREAKITLE